MKWPASIGAAILTALAAALTAGVVASLVVDWYHIPSREGGSGYFVIFMALLGLLGGFLIGIIACRVVAAGAHPGFGRGLGVSLAISLGLIGIIGGVARFLADVPPEIDGETLLLAVEVRFPASRTESPASDTAEGSVTLRSVPHLSHTVRVSQTGPLWKQDAKLVDGHWVVPGAVNIFTGRGKRLLTLDLGDTTRFGILMPLGGRPGHGDLEWSQWMPRARPGAPALPDQMTMRYRVQKQSQVIRTQTVGAFEIGTVSGPYYHGEVDGHPTSLSDARFVIGAHGKTVVVSDSATLTGVAVVAGAGPSLIVLDRSQGSDAGCYLIASDSGGARTESIGDCGGYSIEATELTNDTTRFRSQRSQGRVQGRIDSRMFDRPGLYLMGKSVFDSRNRTVKRFDSDTIYTVVPSVPPLGVSKDERSFVRYGYKQYTNDTLVLAVTDFVANQSYLLPVDPLRMRFPSLDGLDPAWLQHHFIWNRGPDGFDRLVERPHFAPIPYYGEFSEQDGEPKYRIEKAGRELRASLLDFLVTDFKAERMPADSDAYEMPVQIGGKLVNVAATSDFSYVLVSMPGESKDSALIAAIGRRFNGKLASGKFDSMFGP